MRTSRFLIGSFVVLALVQLAVPAMMIVRQERTLASGEQFKFRTQPVDPYDAFRGRYVWLRLEHDSLPLPAGVELQNGQKVYALIETKADGFAGFRELRTTRPGDEPYLTVRVSRIVGQTVYLRVPIDRFYMEESLAPAAERAYREHSRVGNRTAYITVRILNGYGVIDNLWIDGVPIREFVMQK